MKPRFAATIALHRPDGGGHAARNSDGDYVYPKTSPCCDEVPEPCDIAATYVAIREDRTKSQEIATASSELPVPK